MCEIRTPIVNVRFSFTICSKAFAHLFCNTSRLPEIGHNVGQTTREIGNANLLLNMRFLLGMENRRCLINIYRCGLPSDALGCGRSRVGRFNCRPIYMRQDMCLIIESYPIFSIFMEDHRQIDRLILKLFSALYRLHLDLLPFVCLL